MRSPCTQDAAIARIGQPPARQADGQFFDTAIEVGQARKGAVVPTVGRAEIEEEINAVGEVAVTHRRNEAG